LKKTRVQKIFSSLQVNCSGARHKYSVQKLRKACLELRSLEKVWRRREFWPHLLFGWDGQNWGRRANRR